jgi:hypothetical protein
MPLDGDGCGWRQSIGVGRAAMALPGARFHSGQHRHAEGSAVQLDGAPENWEQRIGARSSVEKLPPA